MLATMIDAAGRRRVGALVRAVMAWEGLSGPAIGAQGRVSRASIDRVKRGDDTISDTLLRALGDVLDLPRDFLLYVGNGDVEEVRNSGADPDLVRWTIALMSRPAPTGDELANNNADNNQN